MESSLSSKDSSSYNDLDDWKLSSETFWKTCLAGALSAPAQHGAVHYPVRIQLSDTHAPLACFEYAPHNSPPVTHKHPS